MVAFPHYHLVPKELKANLRWRSEILRDAAEDDSFAAAIKQMCSEDYLFYINGFGWTYDPRDTQFPKKPFITYTEFQDEVIAGAIDAIMKGHDITWPKSRAMGASWIGITVFECFWHFEYELSFLLVSRNEKYVDQAGNPKSMFWKIDYLHLNQPRWLLPTGRWLGWKDPNRKILHLKNADTDTVISGESTTGDAGRGDKRTAMMIDEHAAFEVNEGFKVLRSSRDTANCRIFNSTPQGSTNAFFEIVHKSGAKMFRMHWSKHPEYNRALYTSEKGPDGLYHLKVLDKDFLGVVTTMRKEWDAPGDFIFPEEYPFILDGKLRSPWYDIQESRCVSKQEIAQELDIDFLGSEYLFFDQSFILQLVEECCVQPLLSGRLIFNPVTLEPEGFTEDPKGPLHLWFNLAGNEEVLTDRAFFHGKKFGLGTDVSFGTGASNSVTSVVDLTNGKKVALWKDPRTPPDAFAAETVALAKWFNNGFLAWDASGPSGKAFTKPVVGYKYPNIYYRRDEETTRQRISRQPGYFLNPEDRMVLLQDYRTALADRVFINPSEEGLMETLQFIVKPGGGVEHASAANSQNPTGARGAHGDEVIADALASRLPGFCPHELKTQTLKAPWMSPQWRLEQEEIALAMAEQSDW